jgi:hypothetical protein
VKQESQRRTRSAVAPERSDVSSTVVQKQVGQTLVQFLQVRQRPAISSQRGWFALACSNSLSPSVSVSIGTMRKRSSAAAVTTSWRRCSSASSQMVPYRRTVGRGPSLLPNPTLRSPQTNRVKPHTRLEDQPNVRFG